MRFRWIGAVAKPAVVAGIIALFSYFGVAGQIAGFSLNPGEKDRVARWSAVLSGATRDAIPVTLVDIDGPAMAALGHPERVPRDLVAGLVSLAAAKGASGIFLDMDTSRPLTPEGDAALAARLAAWPANAPPLALARRLGPGVAAADGAEQLVDESSILDAAVRDHPNILWVASTSRVDTDRVVRRWELSQTLCAPAAGHTLASPQLFAAAVAAGPARPLADVEAFTRARTREVCEGQPPAALAWPRNPDPQAAIAFLIADGPDWANPQFISRDGLSVPLFRRLSARALMRLDGTPVAARAVADELFRDRFVIIGASHAESMDGHLTPIGFLPGALVVANAVATAPSVLSGHRLGPVGATVLALALFGILVAATKPLRPLAAAVVVAAIVLGALAGLGRLFAPSTAGDIVLAAFGMLAFFSTLQGVYTLIQDARTRGWRAVLKPATPQDGGGE